MRKYYFIFALLFLSFPLHAGGSDALVAFLREASGWDVNTTSTVWSNAMGGPYRDLSYARALARKTKLKEEYSENKDTWTKGFSEDERVVLEHLITYPFGPQLRELSMIFLALQRENTRVYCDEAWALKGINTLYRAGKPG